MLKKQFSNQTHASFSTSIHAKRLKLFTTVFISIIVVLTVISTQQRTQSRQDAAMKMPMSPAPSHIPGNNQTIVIHIVHKGMGMKGGNGNGVTPMIEESDTAVDMTLMAALSPTMQIGNSKGGNGNGMMHDMFFSPKVVTVPVGTTVEWINEDKGMIHTSTSIKKHADENWDSGKLKYKETFKKKFSKVGVYPYDCDIHPWMRGVIKVVDSAPSGMPSPMPSMPNPSKKPKPSSMPMSPSPMVSTSPMPSMGK